MTGKSTCVTVEGTHPVGTPMARRRVPCDVGGDYQNAYRVVKHAALWARRENA